MTKLALVWTIGALAASPPAWAEPPTFAETRTFAGAELSRQGTGELKARALFATVTLCEFAKYRAREDTQQPAPRLLVLRFTRKLSADQLRQVLRGVVEGRAGATDAELEAFLALLPSVKTDALVQFWEDSKGVLTVFAAEEPLGSVAAPQLAAALWAGLGTDG